MRENAWLIASLAAAIGLVPSDASAQNYCADTSTGWVIDEIPVYIHENLIGICGGNCSNSGLEYQVKAVLQGIYSGSGGVVRPYFAGWALWANYDPGDIIDDAIHVWAGDCTGADYGITSRQYNSIFGFGPYATIKICLTNSQVGTITWDPARDGSQTFGFHTVLIHEMMHALGLNHPDSDQQYNWEGIKCTDLPAGDVVASVVRSPGPSDSLMAADIEFIHDIYGTRTTTGRLRYSTDGLTWTAGPNGPSQTATALGRFAASNSQLGSYVYSAVRNQAKHIVVSRYSQAGSWSFQKDLPHIGFYHPGIAASSSNAVAVAYQVHLDWTTALTDIKTRRTTDGGSTWQSPVTITAGGLPVHTAAPGISQTYNPDTAQYLELWRSALSSDNARIYYHHGTGQAAAHNTAIRTIDTPSIACGPSPIVGTRNCLLAWADAKSWGGIVKWQQCSVASNALSNCSAIRTHGYYTAGSPSVAYVGNNSGYPWQISINQGGYTIYTWRKAAADTVGFVDQRSFTYTPQAVLPAAGSLFSSGTDRRYILTMDQ